ncbi:MAG: FecR domain-containing protein [Tannerellaceae bacterium]|nr:FecR domain-containing protein [Tannerellaceae bacterium]
MEALFLINALKHSDISKQIEERKACIFERINHKINADKACCSMNVKKKNLRLKYLSIACIISLLMLSVVTCYIGYASGKKISAQAQVEILVPYGILSQIKLPDESLVTLNGGSRLSYPASFGKERQVYLSGEGFFDINKDEKHPFTVNSKNISVRVLGTRFSFKAYEEDKQTILTLEEGSISAIPTCKNTKESILLTSDQQLILDHQTGELRRKTVRVKNFTSWKDGYLYFTDMSLGEIATTLERRFNVRITFSSDDIRGERYYAQFENDENAYQILDLLSRKQSWTYTKQNEIINIMKRQ